MGHREEGVGGTEPATVQTDIRSWAEPAGAAHWRGGLPCANLNPLLGSRAGAAVADRAGRNFRIEDTGRTRIGPSIDQEPSPACPSWPFWPWSRSSGFPLGSFSSPPSALIYTLNLYRHRLDHGRRGACARYRVPARMGHPAGPNHPAVGGLIWFVAVVFGLGALQPVTMWQARSTSRAGTAPEPDRQLSKPPRRETSGPWHGPADARQLGADPLPQTQPVGSSRRLPTPPPRPPSRRILGTAATRRARIIRATVSE